MTEYKTIKLKKPQESKENEPIVQHIYVEQKEFPIVKFIFKLFVWIVMIFFVFPALFFGYLLFPVEWNGFNITVAVIIGFIILKLMF